MNARVPMSESVDVVPLRLAGIKCLGAADHGALRRLEAQGAFRTAAAGEVLVANGQYDGTEVYCVLSGRLQACVSHEDGGGVTVEESGFGEAVGLEYALGGDAACAARVSINAIVDSEVAILRVESLREALCASPALAEGVIAALAREAVRLKAAGILRGGEPDARVFAEILALAERESAGGETWLIGNMPKHRDLAERAGVHEADAAAAVARLIREEIVRRDYPGLVIEDYRRLQMLAA